MPAVSTSTRPLSLKPPMPSTDCIKCLLVDDVPENLIALEALLQRDGLEILKAQSGPEALELLLTHSDVALALLDVQPLGVELAQPLQHVLAALLVERIGFAGHLVVVHRVPQPG